MISLVLGDDIWAGYTVSAQLIAEAIENRFAELDWKYGRQLSHTTIAQDVVATICSAAMTLLDLACLEQCLPYLNAVRHEACRFLDRVAFMFGPALTFMSN